MNIYTNLLRDCLLPVGDLFFGQRMMQRLKNLEKNQYLASQQIIAKQSLALQRLITVAYNEVPLYRNLMEERGIQPQHILSAGDLQKMPIMTKDMFRSAYPTGVTRVTGQKTYEAKTSGSTGENFVVLEDAFTAGWYRASFMLALEWSGWKIGDPHLQTGMTLTRSWDRRFKDRLLRCHFPRMF